MLKDRKAHDPNANHISVHPGPFAGGVLSSDENDASLPHHQDSSAGSMPTVFSGAKVPELKSLKGETLVRMSYSPRNKQIHIIMQSTDTNTLHAVFDAPLTLRPGTSNIGAGRVYVGFTATTGNSAYATVSLQSWSLKTTGTDACQTGFKKTASGQCIVTNEEAGHECPRLTSCETCVEDVYNCIWCDSKCVVGTADGVRDCDSIMMEPLACSASLSKLWLYMLLLGLVVVIVFGVVLFRTLPVVQSFRAISVLVALVGGALFGMLISFMTSVSLVEITETPFFSVTFGAFFLLESFLIGNHVHGNEIPERGWDKHVIMLVSATIWLFVSGILCFVVEKRWVHWLSPGSKIAFYSVVGSSLNFALVMSIYDIFAEARNACLDKSRPDRRTPGQASGSRVKLATNTARVALLAVSSFLSGLYFGYMFGSFRIEDESLYRVSLALEQESAYTYPVGAVIGAISSTLLQIVRLPLASDEQIDRFIRKCTG